MTLRRTLVLSFLAVVAIPAIALAANTFVDDDGSVHERSIEAIAQADITRGCNPPENDEFCPNRDVKRGEMAAFLARALDLPNNDNDHFNDDEGHLFEAAINKLAQAGITKGCNPPQNDKFCPEKTVTRGEMAAFLARALSLSDVDGDTFKDDDGSTFERAIEKIAAEGVTKGCNPPQNDRFCPDDPTTRGQMATFLTRVLDLEIPPSDNDPDIFSEGEITGNVCPCLVIGDVELKGQVNLRGDLMVDGGTLTAQPGVEVNGNGHEISVMHGGILDWRGTPKSGWVEWGESVSGWNSGDRLAVAPIAKGDFDVHYDTWTGSWSDVSPSKSVLSDGTEVRAEVANLDRDIVINNVSRIMFHMGAGKQTIKYVAVRNSGVDGELGLYPIHFHLNYNTVRGSLIEGVVVEDGQNHAFVPHGSNGVIFRDVSAVNTRNTAYWWDKPSEGDTSNNSDDTVWEHALALGVIEPADDRNRRLSGFQLGAGIDNTCVECHAAGLRGGTDSMSAFIWPEFTGGGENEEGVWKFADAVGHNNEESGIFVWQNVTRPHKVEDTLLYRNGEHGINHGAYVNTYTYERVRSIDNEQGGHINATGRDGVPLRFVEVEANTVWIIDHHAINGGTPVEYHRVDFSAGVEVTQDKGEAGDHRFYDSNLSPADFTITEIHPDTVISIYEGGALIHQWDDGSWN